MFGRSSSRKQQAAAKAAGKLPQHVHQCHCCPLNLSGTLRRGFQGKVCPSTSLPPPSQSRSSYPSSFYSWRAAFPRLMVSSHPHQHGQQPSPPAPPAPEPPPPPAAAGTAASTVPSQSTQPNSLHCCNLHDKHFRYHRCIDAPHLSSHHHYLTAASSSPSSSSSSSSSSSPSSS